MFNLQVAFLKCAKLFDKDDNPEIVLNNCVYQWVQRVRGCLKYCENMDEKNCTPEFLYLWIKGIPGNKIIGFFKWIQIHE